MCCLHSAVLWQCLKIFNPRLCKSYNLKMAKKTKKQKTTLAKLRWLQSQRVVAAETAVSSLVGFGLIWRLDESAPQLCERSGGHGATLARPWLFFLSVSIELQHSVKLSPESHKTSQESRGLYPLPAFSVKLKLNKRWSHLKGSFSPSAVWNVAMVGALVSSSCMETSEPSTFL